MYIHYTVCIVYQYKYEWKGIKMHIELIQIYLQILWKFSKIVLYPVFPGSKSTKSEYSDC